MTSIRKRLAALVALTLMLVATSIPAFAQSPSDLVRRAAPAGQSASVDHGAWDKLLKTYVKPGADGINRVDYAAFKRSGHSSLKDYVARLQKVDPARLDRKEQFAYLANLYNAKTIDIVLDAYPVNSIKDISLGGGLFAAFTGGPWKAKVVRVKGMELSLDDIEHAILRPVFKDARVHYAVNCASIGCPNFATEAFTGANLVALLNAGARAYVNHPRGVTVSSGRVKTSSIYSWFKEDFGGNDRGVLAHLRTYAEPGLKAKLDRVDAIDGHAHDWRLNDKQAGRS